MNEPNTNNTNASKPNTKPLQPELGMRGAALAHALNLLHTAGYVVSTVPTDTGITINIDGLTLATETDGRTKFVARS